MASKAQIEANRRNAKKSTGPKSERGKAVARMNAVRHGLTAEHVVIPGEDVAGFEALRDELDRELEPVGRQETDLVETIAVATWRRRRIFRMEAGILAYEQAEKAFRLAKRDAAVSMEALDRLEHDDPSDGPDSGGEGDVVDAAEVEQTTLDDSDGDRQPDPEAEAVLARQQAAATRLEEADQKLADMSSGLGTFFLGQPKYPNALERILRYEAAIDRTQARAWEQLAELQSARLDRAATSATIIDVRDAKGPLLDL